MSQNLPPQPPKASLDALVQQLILLPDEKRAKALKMLEERHPEESKQLAQYFKQNKGIVDEALGYEHWLRKLGAHTFTRPFAPIHHAFWSWNWATLIKIKRGELLEDADLTAFIPWSREMGKSSSVEWAAIAEGALLKQGYVVYISGRQTQAEEHVVAIRDRIESEKIAESYPWLGKPKMGAHNNRFGWGREFLMTAGGWAIRPVGLDVAIRGGKTLNMRPTLLICDDIDELGDSPYVVENKERTLTRSILPMGTNKTRVLVAQNPIHSNSMVNRMLTGVSLALSVRKVFGPEPAMRNFAYEVRQTDSGPVPTITSGETTWPAVTQEMWQATLQRVGPESFLSEYQHDMSQQQEERVLPEYDDRVLLLHVISWDMFEKIFGTRRIPSDWPCDLGLDIGYTGKHLSSWSFMTRVPEGYPLAGSVFRYRGRNFTNVSIDDQSIAVRRDMWPDERIERQWMSHEKLGERLLLSGKHDWHFYPCDSSKESGWTAWRHYLRSDRSKAHPFHIDSRDDATGMWKLGRPAFFDVVVHSQLRGPIDDYGLKEHRNSAYTQRRRPVKLTESGLTVDQPVKMGDDPNDSSRMVFASSSFGPQEKTMTPAQRVQALIPEGFRPNDLAVRTDLDANQKHLMGQMAQFLAQKSAGSGKPVILDAFGQELR